VAQYRASLSGRIKRGSIDGVCLYVSRGDFGNERSNAGGASDYLSREGRDAEKKPPLWSGLFAPQNASDRFRHHENARKIWHEAAKGERQHNGQVAEHFIVNLPHELTLEQNIWLAQDHIREFTRDERLVQAAITQ